MKAVLQSVPDLWKVAGDHFEVMRQALAHNLDLVGTALFGDSERIALAGAGDFRVFMSKAGEDGSQILRMVGDDGGKFDTTGHGAQRMGERGFTQQQIADIVNNYSQKVFQSGGRTVYAKKVGHLYYVVILNREGQVISVIGGGTRTLKTWNDVLDMLSHQGGYSTIPLD